MPNKTVVVNFVVYDGGGGESYARWMTEGLCRNNINVVAVLSKHMKTIAKWEKIKGLKIIYVNGYTTKFNFITRSLAQILFGNAKLKKILKSYDVAAVYSPFETNWQSVMWPSYSNYRRIVTIHDPIPHNERNAWTKNMVKFGIKHADEIIVASKQFVDFISKSYNVEKTRLHHIPLGANIPDVCPNDNGEIAFDMSHNKTHFLFFGRIDEYKGLDILGQAYTRLSKEYDNVSLTVAGSGDFSPYVSFFEEASSFTLINEWISDSTLQELFTGDKNIVTIVPYKTATQSGIVPLAMFYKSLIIATKTGGITEQIDDGVTGILLNPNDVEGLYTVMKNVTERKYDIASIVNRAKKHIDSCSYFNLSKALIKILLNCER